MIKLGRENITDSFRETLCNLINLNKCKNIAEVGIWKGDLSRLILERCKPDTLILVDPLSYKLNNQENYTCTTGEPIKQQEELDKIADEINKLPATFYRMTSLEAVKLVEDNSLDFVFIDAMHTYEAVKEDIKAWLPKIRKGGILSGDDYTGKHAPEVKKAVDELLSDVTTVERTWYIEKK